MIEESLNALTSALDRLTAALQHPAPATTTTTATVTPDVAQEPAKRTRRTQAQIAADQKALDEAKPAPKDEPEIPAVSLQSLRALAQKLLDAGHPDKIREINTSLGIARISEAQPEQFAQLEQLLTKALNGLGDI